MSEVRTVVLDASALVEFLRWSTAGTHVAEELSRADVHLPHLAGVETASAFRSLVTRGAVSPERAEAAVLDLAQFPASRHPVEPLLPRIWGLRGSLTAYDATYVALAEALDALLLTADARLARSAGGDVEVALIE